MFFVRVWLREVCLFCLDLVLGLGKKDLSSLFYAFGFMFIVYCLLSIGFGKGKGSYI